jgi:hypothetical protein
LCIPDVIVIIPYRNFYATKAIKTFFLRKNITLPHLAILHEKILRQNEEVGVLSYCFAHRNVCEFFANFEISRDVTQVDKICFTNFVDLAHLAHLPWLISQPSVASTMIIYESLLEPLAS